MWFIIERERERETETEKPCFFCEVMSLFLKHGNMKVFSCKIRIILSKLGLGLCHKGLYTKNLI